MRAYTQSRKNIEGKSFPAKIVFVAKTSVQRPRRGYKAQGVCVRFNVAGRCSLEFFFLLAKISFSFAVQRWHLLCKMARKTCTPFCDTKKTCPKHHDLLLAVVNSSDGSHTSEKASLEQFKETVKAHLKKGWKTDDAIPDPVRNFRFPLLHWAGVLGKCKAMEWMISFGRRMFVFD